jgi:hypothetical protein
MSSTRISSKTSTAAHTSQVARKHHLPRLIALIVVLAALPILVTGQAAASVDLRSPDARDAALAAEQAQQPVDLRSPDARDAARRAESQSVDLRSPDARDAGRATQVRSSGTASQVPASSGNSSNLEWRYLALGGLGSILVLGVAVSSTRRRRLVRPPATVQR